jgi:hypothetical protein
MNTMSPEAAKVIRKLLELSYANGFDSFYRTETLAEAINKPREYVLNTDTETGLLWEYGPLGKGMLAFSHDGDAVSVPVDSLGLLSHWSGYGKEA